MVGAVLDARCMHPGRTARKHLRALAALTGVPAARAEQAVAHVVSQVGLDSVADQRVGGFSLGMRQRLALAGAMPVGVCAGFAGAVMADIPNGVWASA